MRVKITTMFALAVSLGAASMSAAAADAVVDAGAAGKSVAATDANVKAGREIVMDKKLGNCIACHSIPSDTSIEAAGNIGPALTGIKKRFPDRAKLRSQIWDATASNPDSVMPPFGRNKILTEQQIDQVTDYLMSLYF